MCIVINSGWRGPIRTDNAEFCGRLTISWGYLFSYTPIKLYKGVLIFYDGSITPKASVDSRHLVKTLNILYAGLEPAL